MGAWVRVAEFTKAKHLKGGLVARSVAGLPFLLEEGLFCAFVPPVIDVPRQGTVVEVRPEARGGATVFFDTVVDANQADALVGCYVLARREDLPDDVLELQEGGIEGFKIVDDITRSRDWFGSGASVWRVADPRGWEFEITSSNLMNILQLASIDRGVIKAECLYARNGAKKGNAESFCAIGRAEIVGRSVSGSLLVAK